MTLQSILIVDDSSVLRMVLTRALSGRGYSVCAVRDASEALRWVKQNPTADLIITDLHMPEQNGVYLIKQLRSASNYQHTPIFVLTAGAEEKEKQFAREAGATAWIIKPFDPEKLASAIEKVLN